MEFLLSLKKFDVGELRQIYQLEVRRYALICNFDWDIFMDIKEFVQQTITQIAEAVKASSTQVTSLGGVVNPHARERDNLTRVKFDVALTVVDSSEGSVGGKVKVAGIFSAGSELTGKTNQEMVSRVQFEIPLILPDGNPNGGGR